MSKILERIINSENDKRLVLINSRAARTMLMGGDWTNLMIGVRWAWHLPLEPFHQNLLSSSFADIANVHAGEGHAGASTAAAFLSRFVPDNGRRWVHLDLSGSYQKVPNDLWAAGGKGHGVRTSAAMLSRVCEA